MVNWTEKVILLSQINIVDEFSIRGNQNDKNIVTKPDGSVVEYPSQVDRTASTYAETNKFKNTPPIKIMNITDKEGYINVIVGGHLRYLAAGQRHEQEVKVLYATGTYAEAKLEVAKDNATHGLRLNESGNIEAIKLLFTEEVYRKLDSTAISDILGISQPLASRLIRKYYEGVPEVPKVQGKDGKYYPAIQKPVVNTTIEVIPKMWYIGNGERPVVILGPDKGGTSCVVFNAIKDLKEGNKLWGEYPVIKGFNCAYMSYDLSDRQVQDRLKLLEITDIPTQYFDKPLFIMNSNKSISVNEDQLNWMREHKADIYFIDRFDFATDALIELNSANHIKQMGMCMKQINSELNSSFVICAFEGKNPKQEGRAAGSYQIGGFCNMTLRVYCNKDQKYDEVSLITTGEVGQFPYQTKIRLNFDTDTHRLTLDKNQVSTPTNLQKVDNGIKLDGWTQVEAPKQVSTPTNLKSKVEEWSTIDSKDARYFDGRWHQDKLEVDYINKKVRIGAYLGSSKENCMDYEHRVYIADIKDLEWISQNIDIIRSK